MRHPEALVHDECVTCRGNPVAVETGPEESHEGDESFGNG